MSVCVCVCVCVCVFEKERKRIDRRQPFKSHLRCMEPIYQFCSIS